MPISTTFSLKKEDSIKVGKHDFQIDDVNIRTTATEKGDVSYLVVTVTDKATLQQHENLLSAPLSLKKQKFADSSKLSIMLTRFGIMKKTNDLLSYSEVNDLIGVSFEGLVTIDDGFARIDEKTIMVHKKQ